jgi:hypothetical protein
MVRSPKFQPPPTLSGSEQCQTVGEPGGLARPVRPQRQGAHDVG